MVDKVSFIFDGQIASQNRMDFYESARFQYAASRLAVKLDRFRRSGGFPRKVTRDNNSTIDILPFRPGSFGIEILAPALAVAAPIFLEVPLTTLWTYVVERVFKPADEADLRGALASQDNLIETFNNQIAATDNQAERTLDLLRDQIDHDRHLTAENAALRDRLAAEAQRRAYLEGQQDLLRRISAEQDASLITTAAPLLREMNVPMRRSASQVTIRTEDQYGQQDILSANRQMAQDVELSVVDPQLSILGLNIIQYNKENGWGKFRNAEWDGMTSFAVPADRKAELQPRVLDAMNRAIVYVQAYIVRSISGVKLRAIIVDFVDIDAMEQGGR